MTSRNFKVATLTAAAFAVTALLMVYPAIVSSVTADTPTNSTSTTSTNSSTNSASSSSIQWQGPPGPLPGQGGEGGWGYGSPQQRFGGPGIDGQRVSVTDGEAFTITSTTSGEYRVIGSSTENGTASGTITFTVTGSLTTGDTLSISGTVVIGGTTYTISSDSAEMNPSATSISGQGTTSSPVGTFILAASAHGSFVESNGQVSLDLSNGATEYLVLLSGTVTS